MTPEWRKSSRSDSAGNNCVELASLTGSIGVRDSKSPQNGHFSLSQERFKGLVNRIKSGEVDRITA